LSGSPIKIGFAVDESGPEGDVGKPSASVASAWQSWVNANGGIGGRPVKIYITNSQGNPATMEAAVEAFVNTDHVATVMTNDDTTEGNAQPFLTANKIPVIGATGTNTKLWGAQPNYFPMTSQQPGDIQAQPMIAKAVHRSSFAVAVCAEIAACQEAGPVFGGAAKSFGLTYTGLQTISASAPNYTAQCTSFLEHKTEFISLAVVAAVVPRLVQDCQQQGFTGTWGIQGNTFSLPALAAATGATFAGNLPAFPWWVDAPPVEQYRQVMAKYAPGVSIANIESTSVWSALQLFRVAIGTPKGPVTPASVTAAYDRIHDQTLGGLLPQPLTFTAGKPAPDVNCVWLFTYKVGEPNPVDIYVGKSGNGQTGPLRSSCTPGRG
jgi:branched-chain amino acid transport system substrate-binding protein